MLSYSKILSNVGRKAYIYIFLDFWKCQGTIICMQRNAKKALTKYDEHFSLFSVSQQQLMLNLDPFGTCA